MIYFHFVLFFRIALDSVGKMKAERSAIVGKLLAQMMVMSGFTQIITMDLHQKELQGFFDCPVDNLRASPFFISYIQQKVSPKSAEKVAFLPMTFF